MSGLSHTPGKRARGKTLRGFESPLLRQYPNKHAPSGAFCFCSHQSIHQFVKRLNWLLMKQKSHCFQWLQCGDSSRIQETHKK